MSNDPIISNIPVVEENSEERSFKGKVAYLQNPRSPTKSIQPMDVPPPALSVSIICRTQPVGDRDFGYDISIVEFGDLSAETRTVRLSGEFFRHATFCVFGSTVYVFEGYDKVTNPAGKSVYSFVLGSGVSYLKLKRSMLVEVCRMNRIKLSPIAIPTRDGKGILVYSSLICLDRVDSCDFELFIPAQRKSKCHKLPGIRPWFRDSEVSYFRIATFSFIKKSVLLVQTDMGGLYALDLQSKSWKRVYNFRGSPLLPGHIVLIGQDIGLYKCCAYDIDVKHLGRFEDAFGRWFYTYPEFTPLPDVYLSRVCSITLLEDEVDSVIRPKECKFCILQIGLKEEGEKEGETMYIPHLFLDVYQCDLTECREGLQKYRDLKMTRDYSGERRDSIDLPGARRITSFNFCLNPQVSDWWFPSSFSAIPVDNVSISDIAD